jgi:hypothetical protein
MRWAGHVLLMGENKTAYRLVVLKSEGNRSLGRPKRRWLDNITMILAEIEWGSVTGIV